MTELKFELPRKAGIFSTEGVEVRPYADVLSASNTQVTAWAAKNAQALGFQVAVVEGAWVYLPELNAVRVPDNKLVSEGSAWDPMNDDQDAYRLAKYLSGLYPAMYVSIAEAFRCLLKDHVGFDDLLKDTRIALTRRVASRVFE